MNKKVLWCAVVTIGVGMAPMAWADCEESYERPAPELSRAIEQVRAEQAAAIERQAARALAALKTEVQMALAHGAGNGESRTVNAAP